MAFGGSSRVDVALNFAVEPKSVDEALRQDRDLSGRKTTNKTAIIFRTRSCLGHNSNALTVHVMIIVDRMGYYTSKQAEKVVLRPPTPEINADFRPSSTRILQPTLHHYLLAVVGVRV